MKEILRSFWNFFLDIAEVITTAFALFVVTFLFVAQIHEVRGDSMLPDFHDHEFVLTDKISYRFRNPERGEIVIFYAPPQPTEEYIKRIIALPGEKIKIQNSRVIIKNREHPEGFALTESYLAPGTAVKDGLAIPENTEVTVPADTYIVMGDNRGASSDSRQWGGVRKEKIVGHAFLRIWPPTAIAAITRASY